MHLREDFQYTFVLNNEFLEVFHQDSVDSIFISKHSRAPAVFNNTFFSRKIHYNKSLIRYVQYYIFELVFYLVFYLYTKSEFFISLETIKHCPPKTITDTRYMILAYNHSALHYVGHEIERASCYANITNIRIIRT